MADYKNILDHVFKWEGGYVYIPEEKQSTNMGIQYSTYKRLSKKLLGIQPTPQHHKTMSKAEAAKFIQWYWNRATYNNAIRDQAAANLMFQAYWGSGGSGIKTMQKALRVKPDGEVGPQTVNKINSLGKGAAPLLYQALENKYKYLGSKPRYKRFLRGWLNRLNELKPTGKIITGAGFLVLASIALYYFTK